MSWRLNIYPCRHFHVNDAPLPQINETWGVVISEPNAGSEVNRMCEKLLRNVPGRMSKEIWSLISSQ